MGSNQQSFLADCVKFLKIILPTTILVFTILVLAALLLSPLFISDHPLYSKGYFNPPADWERLQHFFPDREPALIELSKNSEISGWFIWLICLPILSLLYFLLRKCSSLAKLLLWGIVTWPLFVLYVWGGIIILVQQ